MADKIIAVDAMGGDRAPEAIVAGCLEALRAYHDVQILLAGPPDVLTRLLEDGGAARERVQILPSDEVIDAHEAPVLAVRRKKTSSLVVAMLAVKEGKAQACVSAGPTGAVLAGGMLRVGRIRGIERPALAPVLPGQNNPFLLIDSGANVDCQPKYLEQFGLMGSVYMEKILRVDKPRVMLANIGAEDEKGNQLAKEAHARMRAQTAYQFLGNIEGREIPRGDADVVVCDGFDGNLILKYTEGLAAALVGMLKEEMLSSTRAKIGALLLKPALRAFKKRMDYEEYGGAPLLGVEGAVVKAHGSSNAQAIKNAIRQARAMVEGDVVGQIRAGLSQLTADEAKGGEENV